MKKVFLAFLFAAFALIISSAVFADDLPGYTDTPFIPNSEWRVHDKNRPQPPKVTPGTGDLGATPPADAVILFDGTNLDAWKRNDGQPIPEDAIQDGTFNIRKTSYIRTKEDLGSIQLHLEWRSPTTPENRMSWGNSGVFLMDAFEIQISESHDSNIYADGIAGAIYGQFPPMVNPSRKPGEWQSYDIFFTAPRFEDRTLVSPAYVTVIYNGVLVQNHRELLGTTRHKEAPYPYPIQEKRALMLQEHNSEVLFRNIWYREIKDAE